MGGRVNEKVVLPAQITDRLLQIRKSAKAAGYDVRAVSMPYDQVRTLMGYAVNSMNFSPDSVEGAMQMRWMEDPDQFTRDAVSKGFRYMGMKITIQE